MKTLKGCCEYCEERSALWPYDNFQCEPAHQMEAKLTGKCSNFQIGAMILYTQMSSGEDADVIVEEYNAKYLPESASRNDDEVGTGG